jgi:hypothetical protein
VDTGKHSDGSPESLVTMQASEATEQSNTSDAQTARTHGAKRHERVNAPATFGEAKETRHENSRRRNARLKK